MNDGPEIKQKLAHTASKQEPDRFCESMALGRGRSCAMVSYLTCSICTFARQGSCLEMSDPLKAESSQNYARRIQI